MSEALWDARVQSHWAAQAAAAVGRALVPPKDDDSHMSFTWSRELRAVMQEPVNDGRRAALRIADLTLLVVRGDGTIDRELALHGRTMNEADAFFERAFGRALVHATEGPPHHVVAGGAAFDANRDALRELASIYDDAATLLESLRARTPNASAVRCWPHHFDIATLIERGGGRTIGIGMQPGDEGHRAPYWYVTAWPAPSSAPPQLTRGAWHTQGWFGALLDVAAGSAAEFVDEAVRVLMSTA